MKKIIALILTLLLILSSLLLLSGCENGKKGTIGIIQFGSHASLNNCREGILAGLVENGIDIDEYEIEILNSNFDTAVAQTQANKLVNSRVDVIIAIATPAAVAAANAADGVVPVVFCAVTDPEVMSGYTNVTGSSDIPDFNRQLEVVTAVMGRSRLKIGVLYSTDEASSPIQVSELKRAAESHPGMTVTANAVSDITTIDTRVNELISEGVDCFVNLLDNTIVGKLETNILPLTNEAGIPVFGSEIEQVRIGCAASASIEYKNVGRLSGKAAAAILGGAEASSLAVATVTEPALCFNEGVLKDLGLEGADTSGMKNISAKE